MRIISLLNSSSDNCSSALKLSADQSSLTVGQLQLRNNLLLLDSSADQNCFADQNVLLLDSSAVQSCFAAEQLQMRTITLLDSFTDQKRSFI
jgi:hypothetical protein